MEPFLNQVLQGYTTAGAYQSQAAFQSSQYETQATLADFQAKDAIDQGSLASSAKTRQTNATVGAQKAALGAQGVNVNSGSAASTTAATSSLGALDALTIRNNAYKQAFGYETQANQFELQAKTASISGNNNAEQAKLAISANIESQMALTSLRVNGMAGKMGGGGMPGMPGSGSSSGAGAGGAGGTASASSLGSGSTSAAATSGGMTGLDALGVDPELAMAAAG